MMEIYPEFRKYQYKIDTKKSIYMPVKDVILTLKILILGQILQKCVFYDKMKNKNFRGLLAPLAPLTMLRTANSSVNNFELTPAAENSLDSPKNGCIPLAIISNIARGGSGVGVIFNKIFICNFVMFFSG